MNRIATRPMKRIRIIASQPAPRINGRARMVIVAALLWPPFVLLPLPFFGYGWNDWDIAIILWGLAMALSAAITYAILGIGYLLDWMKARLSPGERRSWLLLRRIALSVAIGLVALTCAQAFRYEIHPLGYRQGFLKHDRFTGETTLESAREEGAPRGRSRAKTL